FCNVSNNNAPTLETPPPITIRSVSNVLIKFTQAIPRISNTRSIYGTIFECPSLYKSNNSLVVKVSIKFFIYSLDIAVYEDIFTNQPYCPQTHFPNEGSTTTWPISPAFPF